MSVLLLALLAGYGVHLLWTGVVDGRSGLAIGPPRPPRPTRPPALRRWLVEAGLEDLAPREFVSATLAIALVGGLLAYATFGSPAPAVLAAVSAAGIPLVTFRTRRRERRERAQEAWPRLIEEVRILTGSVGRSIPQALFEASRRAPAELQRAFETAHREWLITTDFARTTAVLRSLLADPTADAACETLLVAHEVGGADLDRRLEALAEDRIQDIQGRKDARAEQSGVRFARRFVLIVPLGMALAGMSVGNGRAAYQEPEGQVTVIIAMVLVVACWIWAGRILRLPDEQRVFDS